MNILRFHLTTFGTPIALDVEHVYYPDIGRAEIYRKWLVIDNAPVRELSHELTDLEEQLLEQHLTAHLTPTTP